MRTSLRSSAIARLWGTFLMVATVAVGCSSTTDETGPGDAGEAEAATKSDAGGPVAQLDAGAPETGSDSGTPSNPCANAPGATAAGQKKAERLGAQTATGGTLKDGVYTLKYWGKQTGTVGIAYELAVNLRLTLGTPNTYAVGEYYQNGSHSGGGTFTIDPTTKKLAFTKTCGAVNVGLGDVDTPLYSVDATELKLFNFGLYGAGDILIFNVPL